MCLMPTMPELASTGQKGSSLDANRLVRKRQSKDHTTNIGFERAMNLRQHWVVAQELH